MSTGYEDPERERKLQVLREIAQEFQAMDDEAFHAMLDRHADGKFCRALEYALISGNEPTSIP